MHTATAQLKSIDIKTKHKTKGENPRKKQGFNRNFSHDSRSFRLLLFFSGQINVILCSMMIYLVKRNTEIIIKKKKLKGLTTPSHIYIYNTMAYWLIDDDRMGGQIHGMQSSITRHYFFFNSKIVLFWFFFNFFFVSLYTYYILRNCGYTFFRLKKCC